MYNADQVKDALERPKIIVNGQEYTGIVLSIFERQDLVNRLEEITSRENADPADTARDTVGAVCKAVMPTLDPDILLRQPEPVFEGALQYFLSFLRRRKPSGAPTPQPTSAEPPSDA